MSDAEQWWQGVNWLDVFLTSGLLTTLLTIFLKWRHDKKKMPLERAQVESGIASENMASAMSINAEYREQLRVVKESMKEENARQRALYESEIEALRRHQEHNLNNLRDRLDNLEDSNGELKTKVHRLEMDDRTNQQVLTKQHKRIGKLERNLTSAKDVVVNLMQYIKEHPERTGEIPQVDYSIFDI